MGFCWSFRSASKPASPTATACIDPSKSQTRRKSYPQGQILPAPQLRLFSLQQLEAATGNFSPANRLGEGGFGPVYKGWLSDELGSGGGMDVAIKKLNCESGQGPTEWQTEIDILGRLTHPSLVKLLGYCSEDQEHLLVYEFMQQGNLGTHLYARTGLLLPWDRRISIAVDIAGGFDFLHTSVDRVIFRDMKPSNILLDHDYKAKIADFGLARLGPLCGHSHVSTVVKGTPGYVAPEYATTGHVYVKSDVYCFGILLLELLTGLQALDRRLPEGQKHLVIWCKPFLSSPRKLETIMDNRLEERYPPPAALKTAKLALRCLAQKPKNRPSMKEVLQSLKEIQATGEAHKDKTSNPTPRSRAMVKHWLCSTQVQD